MAENFTKKRLGMDFKDIKELIRVFDKSELSKLKVKEGEFEISMQKGFEGGTVLAAPSIVTTTQTAPVQQTSTPSVSNVATETNTSTAKSGDAINSPMVGTFYASPSPESPAFVKAGDTVKKGQTLCILEAMKIMNEVEAEFDCKIIEILVENGSPVEYDMPIFLVEKL